MCTLTIKYNADNALAQSIIAMMKQTGVFEFQEEDYALEEDSLMPYTIEELNASIDEAERSVANGEVYDHDDVMAYFDNYINESAKKQKTYA